MRLDFKPTESKSEYFIIEQLVEHEWHQVDSIHPVVAKFDDVESAHKQMMTLAKLKGEKFRILRIVKTVTTTFDADVCEEV